MTWTTLRLTVTTPLFNGGGTNDEAGDPDGTGVRVSSLRGAMRFWFRALAAAITGPDLRLLARLERTVFGSTGAASPVRLRIPRQPPLTATTADHSFLPRRGAKSDEIRNHPGRWIVYLLGQGHGDLRNCTLTRPYVAPGEGFELKLWFGPDADRAALALASLWMTCAYGGLGARVRRGFGGLRIVGAEGPLPAPWTPDSVLSPPLSHYTALTRLWPTGPLNACMSCLVRMAKSDKHVADGKARLAPDAWDLPPFPMLSRKHTRAGASGGEPFADWSDVASHAGEQLRRFRASSEHPEVAHRYSPPRKTPEWTNVVLEDNDDWFPLGALGLPVHFKDGYRVNAERKGEPLRRASTLWLRPVGDDTGWRLFSFAFLGSFLSGPRAPNVQLRGGREPRTLRVRDDDATLLAETWIPRLAQDEWQWFADGDRPAP